ncbi:hypothetical protein HMSSN036_58970 [Paenibacillus macerans]|nr:hypothetical protein HMSSN036_58970 [Paenibacillus macerans]
MKTITVQSLANMFHMEVLAGAGRMDRVITRPRAHRPGLEFVGYFDFFPMERVQVLGRKEVNYLLTLSIEERKLHIGNIVKYHPPCFIVTSGQQEIPYLTLFCDQEGIPLLRTEETTTEFIAKLDSYLVKTLAPEISIHGVCVNVSGIGVLLRGNPGLAKAKPPTRSSEGATGSLRMILWC